jgi:hypothetical protein
MSQVIRRITHAILPPAVLKRLLLVAALTIIANDFLWRHHVGSGRPLYAWLLCLGVIASARGLHNVRWLWLLLLLFAGSILAGVNATSFSNFISLVGILTLLVGACFYRSRSLWQKISRAILSFCGTPFRWGRVGLIVYRLHLARGCGKPDWRLFQQTLLVSFTAAVPILLIGTFLISGNLILGTWFNSFINDFFRTFLNFSVFHWLFLGFFATVALGFVWPGRRRLRSFSFPALPYPSASPTWIWGARAVLWLMNALFLLANTVDALFLWLRNRPPAGVTYSDFVHHGTNNLIFATLWSALIIILIIEGFSASAPDLRLAAVIWIGQNMILIFGVFRRLKLYVDAYNLTILRLGVALFLLLVLTGFILLGIYILQKRGFSWLCGSGCIAVFSLFYILQFSDLAGFVASYNVDRWIQPNAHTQVDLNYLEELGPSSWSALRRLADSDSRFAEPAQRVLTRIRSTVLQRSSRKKHWQSFQLRRSLCEAQILQWTPP